MAGRFARIVVSAAATAIAAAAVPAVAATGPRTTPAATTLFIIYLAPASKGGSDNPYGERSGMP